MVANVGMNNAIYYSDMKIKQNDNIQSPEDVTNIPIDCDNSDCLELSNKNTEAKSMTTEEMREELQKTKDEQGIVGKTWDSIKNKCGFLSKCGMKGSKEIEEIIAKAEAGEISEEEAQKAVEKYKSNQEKTTKLVLDTATIAIVSAVCLLAGPLGWGIGATLAVATATGAVARLGLGITEAATNNVKGDYTMKDACEDFTRGGVLGFITGLGKVFKSKISGKIARKIADNAATGGTITKEAFVYSRKFLEKDKMGTSIFDVINA